MITRSVDASGDWKLGKGKEDYLNDLNALPQNVKTRLLSFINDCYFDLGAGIDWFYYLGRKDINGMKSAIAETITQTLGIDTLTELSFNIGENRNLLIQYSATTTWGTTLENVTVDVG